jgi:hypothetical protein
MFRIRIAEINHICAAGVRKWTEGGGGDAHDSHERERDQLRPGHQDCRPPDPSGKTLKTEISVVISFLVATNFTKL